MANGSFKIKALFFDSPKILRYMDDLSRKALGKAAGTLAKFARFSLRSRKAGTHAPPGQPPYSHVGLLKHGIQYGLDPGKRTVVIGPVPLRGEGEAPNLLEFSGTARRKGIIRGGKFRSVGKGYKGETVTKTIHVAARPYMGPALAKIGPTVPSNWAQSVNAAA